MWIWTLDFAEYFWGILPLYQCIASLSIIQLKVGTKFTFYPEDKMLVFLRRNGPASFIVACGFAEKYFNTHQDVFRLDVLGG